MNPQPLDDQQDSGYIELGEGVGRCLRAARIDRGLELERIAAQLHLKSSLIDALEAGRYEDLPGPVFVAGYIRNYARQVGLDPEPLISAYLSAEKRAEPARAWSQSRVARRDRGGSRLLIRLMTVAVVAGVAYLFAQWWQNRAPTVSELVGEPASVLDPEATDETLDQAGSTAEEPLAGANEAPSPTGGSTAERNDAALSPYAVPAVVAVNPGADIPPPVTAPAPTQEAAQADSAPVAGASESTAQGSLDQGDVVLEFRGPCWVDVRDSTKSFSLTGEMTKGDRRVLGGTPPYSLILGNASAVAVTVRGTPFDLTRVAKGNVARFKLDPAELP